VGRTLTAQAVAAGWKVKALTRHMQASREGVEWVVGTLEDLHGLWQLVQHVDAVIHVAGVVNAPDRAGFEAGNVAGTLAMVEAASAAKVRKFIHVSSLAARHPELSNYGWSKAKAEKIVAASALDWTMVRPPWIYGPGDADSLDVFKAAKRGLVPIPCKGDVSVLEVSDLARLLLALIDAPDARSQIYEPDDGRDDWTHAKFARAIGWAFEKRVSVVAVPKPLMLFGARLDRLFRGKHAKLTADRVGYMVHPDWRASPAARPPAHIWQPQVNSRAGLKDTIAAYRAAGWIK
jgi:nucleoside-diphosphate-sugar epimerase